MFQEILFTRIGVDLCEKLIDDLKEREAQAAQPVVRGAGETAPQGSIAIDANIPNAEVRGYKAWKKDVLILAGAASRLVAELEFDSGQQ